MKLLKIHKKNKGFTVVELLVVVSIMVVMTTIVLFNYNKFNDSMLISNLAYDVSLTIRQAQTYGVSVLEVPGLNSGLQINSASNSHANFVFPYGVHFETNSTGNGNFTLFIDGDNNGMYTNVSEKVQSYSFQRGIKVFKLCVSKNNITTCSTSNTATLDLSFLRPNPDARIVGDATSACSSVAANCVSAVIVLSNPNGTVLKSIVVNSSGQISVQ